MKRVERYELAWAEALAEEHGHQRELLATLHGELAAFAGECAAALTALDALVSLGPVGALLDSAKAGVQNVALARDISRRLPALARNAPHEDQLSGFYTHLGGEADLSPAVVHQAGEFLRADPQRSDRVLLNAIIEAAGARSVIRQVVGPASVTAMYALTPLGRWAPSLAKLGRENGGDAEVVAAAHKDLTSILQSTAAATGQTLAADAVAFADSLRDTVEHVEKAARAISEGRLEQAIAEARHQLEGDLDELRAVHEGAEHAPHAWHLARSEEHAELVEEVREKLEKVQKIRRALGLILPHLQITARALATIEKLRSIEGRLDSNGASGLDAVRMSLVLVAAEVAEASLAESRHPVRPLLRRLPRLWLVGAALILLAAGIAIALSLGGHSNKAAAPNTILNVTPQQGIPPAPTVSPLRSTFNPTQRATFYSIAVTAAHQGKLIYSWHLNPPKDNQTCNKFGSIFGSPNRAVWHHASTDGCTHLGVQHLGTVTVTIRSRYWQCTASFFGTLTSAGVPAKACTRI